MKINKAWILLLLCLGLSACQLFISTTLETPEVEVPGSPAAIANPAAMYCVEIMGYEYKIISAEDGSQSGFCVMPDDELCNQWAFFAGECGAEHSYCVKEGLEIETRSDGADPYAKTYGVCVDNEGNEVLVISDLLINQ